MLRSSPSTLSPKVGSTAGIGLAGRLRLEMRLETGFFLEEEATGLRVVLVFGLVAPNPIAGKSPAIRRQINIRRMVLCASFCTYYNLRDSNYSCFFHKIQPGKPRFEISTTLLFHHLRIGSAPARGEFSVGVQTLHHVHARHDFPERRKSCFVEHGAVVF